MTGAPLWCLRTLWYKYMGNGWIQASVSQPSPPRRISGCETRDALTSSTNTHGSPTVLTAPLHLASYRQSKVSFVHKGSEQQSWGCISCRLIYHVFGRHSTPDHGIPDNTAVLYVICVDKTQLTWILALWKSLDWSSRSALLFALGFFIFAGPSLPLVEMAADARWNLTADCGLHCCHTNINKRNKHPFKTSCFQASSVKDVVSSRKPLSTWVNACIKRDYVADEISALLM